MFASFHPLSWSLRLWQCIFFICCINLLTAQVQNHKERCRQIFVVFIGHADTDLSQAVAVNVPLNPLQPVRVLLFTHTFIHLIAQLLCSLKRILQVPIVCMVCWCVFQYLNMGHGEHCRWVLYSNADPNTCKVKRNTNMQIFGLSPFSSNKTTVK